VGAENLRKAHSVHPVTALEIEYSLACRFAEHEILPAARELGIGVVPYRVLGDGLLTGALPAEAANPVPRFTAPRLQGENRRHNVAAVAPFLAMAKAKGVTPAALALAWLLSRGEDIVPVGSRKHWPRWTSSFPMRNSPRSTRCSLPARSPATATRQRFRKYPPARKITAIRGHPLTLMTASDSAPPSLRAGAAAITSASSATRTPDTWPTPAGRITRIQ
jgi:hypothetical protein